MKFGQELDEHIRRCEADIRRQCSRSEYVDYKHLKRRIKEGLSQDEFQELYQHEVARLTEALQRGSSLHRDPEYIGINRRALDKISKKFDKRLAGQIRAANWVTTAAELGQVLGALQIDDSFVPPDLRHSSDLSEAQGERQRPSGSLVFVAGAVSGISSRTLTAPLDRIKLMLQAGDALPLGTKPTFVVSTAASGRLRNAARAILSDGGVRAFWQGNGANVLKVMPESAIKFYVYDQIKVAKLTGDLLPVSERLFAGCIAGAVSQLVVYPLDVTKTRLALASVGTYLGIWHCMRQTFVEEGPRALYKGVGPALLAIIPASGIDLAVYNTLRVRYRERTQKQGSPAQDIPIGLAFCFGAMSATCGALVAYPLTVIRTQLIAQGMPGRPRKYRGMYHCFRSMLAESGVLGMYRGLAPAMLKTIPAMSIGYGSFEAAKRLGGGVSNLDV